MATDTLCGDCPHCAHWQGGHYCERHREFLRYGDDQPLRCEACVKKPWSPPVTSVLVVEDDPQNDDRIDVLVYRTFRDAKTTIIRKPPSYADHKADVILFDVGCIDSPLPLGVMVPDSLVAGNRDAILRLSDLYPGVPIILHSMLSPRASNIVDEIKEQHPDALIYDCVLDDHDLRPLLRDVLCVRGVRDEPRRGPTGEEVLR